MVKDCVDLASGKKFSLILIITSEDFDYTKIPIDKIVEILNKRKFFEIKIIRGEETHQIIPITMVKE